MKRILVTLTILLFFISLNSYSQDLVDLESVYQKILNDKDFIAATGIPDFNCDTITYSNSLQYSNINLTFRGKKLFRYNEVEHDEKPFFIIDTINYGKTTKVNITLRVNKKSKGRCIISTNVEYTCIVKKKKEYVIKKPKISTYSRSVMLM